MPFFSPSTVEEAVRLLSTSPLPCDAPTQHRYRSQAHLHDAFATGRRRPEWVWAAGSPDRPLGVLAALGSSEGGPEVLDHLGLPEDPDLARELVQHASDRVRSLGCEEVCIFAPAGARFDDVTLRPVVAPLRSAGWRLLVERRHYEFEPSPDLGADLTTQLRFETVPDEADPRLAAVYREVLRDSLDAHDRAGVESLGFEAAAVDGLAYLLGADPVECLRLASDPAGEVVGMVSGRCLPSGRAFVLFVGVAHAARGHGYGREMTAWMTHRLVAEGAVVLIADTDYPNVPMAAAFADAGWPQTETRIDLVC